MKLIELNKKFIKVPESWNELTAKQLVAVMNYLFIRNDPDNARTLHLQRILLGLSENQYRKLPADEVDEFLYLVEFLFQEKIELTKNILPEYADKNLEGELDVFYGPADECMNLTAVELAFAESHMMQWFAEKSEEELDKLVSILYRPGKKDYDAERNPDGDLREAFNENISYYNAKKYIRLWPKSAKLAILFWFRGCWQKWVDDNDKVFNGSGDPALHGMISVLRNVAKDGIYGDIDKVNKMVVPNLLIELSEVIAEAEKIKKSTPTT
jgi:hypothetical protein